MQVREGMSTRDPDGRPGPHAAPGGGADGRARRRRGGRIDPEAHGPGIITERDLLLSIGRGEDPDTEHVADHLTRRPRLRGPGLVARAGGRRDGARRLPPPDRVDGGETSGILSVRDIVRCWTDDGASCELPQAARRAAGRRGVRGRAALRRARVAGASGRAAAQWVLERELVHLAPRRRGSRRSSSRRTAAARRRSGTARS